MSVCVLDTDVVIGALDRADAHHARAAAPVTRLLEAGTPMYLSLINYAETLVRPAQAPETFKAAVDAIAALGLRLHEPDPKSRVTLHAGEGWM